MANEIDSLDIVIQTTADGVDQKAKKAKQVLGDLGKSLKETEDRARQAVKAMDFSSVADVQRRVSELTRSINGDILKIAKAENRGASAKSLDTLRSNLEFDKALLKEMNTLADGFKMPNVEMPAYSFNGENFADFDSFWKAKQAAEEAVQKISESVQQAIQPIEQLKQEVTSVEPVIQNATDSAISGMDNAEKETSEWANMVALLKQTVSDVPNLMSALGKKIKGMFSGMNESLVNSGLKTYTQEHIEVQNEIKQTEKTLADLQAAMARGLATNNRFEDSTTFKKMQYDIDEARNSLKYLKGELADLESTGGAYQWNTSEIVALAEPIKKIENALSKVNNKISDVIKKFNIFSHHAKSAKKSSDGFTLSNIGLANSLLRTSKMLKLMIIRMALRGVIDNAKSGFKSLARYSDEVNASLSMLMNVLHQLANSFAAAVAPILNAFAPALEYIINLVINVVNVINQLLSALGGGGTWIRAKKLSDDYAKSLDKATGAAKKLKTTTLGIDELNINSGDDGVSGGGASAASPADMFETLPIEDKWKNFADKLKDIFSKLFAPFKAAWEREGQFVMDSWKYALEQVKQLVNDIGRDFLIMWNQESTINMFANILHIIGDIGLIVGNLAKNLDEAWNHNQLGLRILENIRDIFAVIVWNIRQAADYTVEWSETLNFIPLFESIEKYTQSLEKVVGTLSATMRDFYVTVLLPLASWAIEKGLPELLDIFTDFNNKVDWAKLRRDLQDFWEHLEPFAETVGDGLLIFIRDLSDLLANFVNSETFSNFLDHLGEWMDSVKPEDVARGIEDLAKAFITLRVSLLLLDATVKGMTFFETLSKTSESISKVNVSIMELAQYIALLNPEMFAFLGIKLIDRIQGTALDPNEWDNVLGDIYRAIAEFNNNVADSVIRLLDGIVTLFTHPIETIKKAFGELFNWDETAKIFEEAKEHIEKAFDGENIGKNLILGIVKGIGGALAFLFEPLTDLANTIINAVKELLGIHSPSTVFAEIGTNIVLGLLQGLEETWNQVTEWWDNTALAVWWDEHVKPWFSLDKWLELFENIKVSIKTKWDETVVQWATDIQQWWDANVKPWFTLEKWNAELDHIKKSFKTKWDETVVQWIKNLEEWWKKHVEPWFNKDKWIELLQSIPDSFLEAFTHAKEWAVGQVEEMYNTVIGWIESISSAIQAIGSAISGVVSAIGSGISSKLNIGVRHFATGGFPEDGWFRASHGEMIGRFDNGQSVVANNQQITEGIAMGVARANSEQNELLREQNALLRELLAKDSTVSIDGRTIVSAYDSAKTRNGYSFT